jgi:hypothetical protein
MGNARRQRGVTPVKPIAKKPGAPSLPEPTVVQWSVSDVIAAFEDLTLLLRQNPDGAFGYKASIIRMILDPFWSSATSKTLELRKAYQKYVPSEGKDGEPGEMMPLPWEQGGREMPLDFWNTNPREFKIKLARLNSTVNTITFPVRFTYEEVRAYREPVRDLSGAVASWQGIRGAFWNNLYALIDPPADMAGLKLPAPGPTIDPLLATLDEGEGDDESSSEA